MSQRDGKKSSQPQGMNLEARKKQMMQREISIPDKQTMGGIRDAVAASDHAPSGARNAAQGTQRASSGAQSVAQGSEKVASGAKDVAEGSQQAATGAARASQGAGRVMAGDLTGSVDVAKGAKDTVQGGVKAVKGAQEVKEGAEEVKEGAEEIKAGVDDALDGDSDNQPGDPNNQSSGGNYPSGVGAQNGASSPLASPYDPNNYKSLFDDKDENVDEMDDSDAEADDSGGYNSLYDEGDNSNKDKDQSKSDDKNDDNKDKGMKDLMSDDEDDDSDSDEDEDEDEDDGDIDLKDMAAKAQTAQAAASAYSSLMAVRAFMAMLQWMQNMAMAIGSAISSAWATAMAAFQSVISTVATVTGLSAAWSAAVAVSTVVVAGATAAVAIVTGTGNDVEKYDDLYCLPDQTQVSSSVTEWEGSGDTSAQYEENINKAWSFMSEMGVSPVAFSGIIGNFTHESSMDPTGVETIYSEPFQIGPRKAKAEGYDFEMSKIDPAYQRRFPGVKKAGIGIAQWSNGRNVTLRDYAEGIGADWFDIGVQLAFMFDGDNASDRKLMKEIAEDSSLTIEEVTKRFMLEWERPSPDAYYLEERYQAAAEVYFKIETMEVDTEYAQSIISGMNTQVSISNSNRSAYIQDDGCGQEVQSHYHKVPDGTGVFPEGVGTMWTPESLPESVKKFTHDPKDVGMSYGSTMGWQPTSHPGQCVALSHSYMVAIYGLSTVHGVNGADVARGWYDAHHATSGGQLLNAPQAGAVFGYKNTGVYGHTGVVQHVFANGDILILEQNVRGISGDNNGTPNTWGWRYFPVTSYTEHNKNSYDWDFYKPDLEPKWSN